MSPVGPVPNQGQIAAEGLIHLRIGNDMSASGSNPHMCSQLTT